MYEDLKEEIRQEELREIMDEYTTTCWRCEEKVDQSEIVTVTDGRTYWKELCPDCFEFHQTKR
ncbi:hypothetical protein SAMN05421743_104128 [Thalassobacillus cyri]|uniref:Uncharacterized protein n=1 Tax=Thalassobacillus cyri TaxID=571932 RepID=A0A1H4AL41_9BACI|nr:hypothetical protein [Thalassobacillus cyri]SEA36471.1 hypothetical protein SAMN05421743_104128 [Thalassobacillus cyri]